MSKVEDFLSASEEKAIVDAIRVSERNTSGEIRVHIEKKSSTEALIRAKEVFDFLEMYKTEARNGVLFYVAVKSKQFAICGDEGIHKKVGDDFWNSTKEIILNQFKNGNFSQGLIDGILKAGEQLKSHFPYEDDDIDELSNEISKS